MMCFQEETIEGAKNRAVNAYRAYRESNSIFPHLSFGLEGGLEWSSIILDQDDKKTLWCMAWMAVFGKRKSLLVDIIASRQSTCWQPGTFVFEFIKQVVLTIFLKKLNGKYL